MTTVLFPPPAPPPAAETIRGDVVRADGERKAALVRGWLSFRQGRPGARVGELRREFVKSIPKHERPPARTLRRWESQFAAGGEAALCDRRVARYAAGLDPALWAEFVGLLREHGGIATRAHRAMREKHAAAWPSLARVSEELRAHGQRKRRREAFDGELWAIFAALAGSGKVASVAQADRIVRLIAGVMNRKWPAARDVYTRLRAERDRVERAAPSAN